MNWFGIIILFVLIALSVAGFLPPLLARLRRVQAAPGRWDLDPLAPRIRRFVWEVLLQAKVIRERPLAGLAHAFVYWGFMVFAFITVDHFCIALGFSPLSWFGSLGHWFHKWFASLWAVVVLAGILYLAYRRFVLKPKALGDHLSMTSGLVAALITILMVTHLLFAFGIWLSWTVWWIHALAILVFPPLIVRSKHMHLVLGPFAVFLQDPVAGRIGTLNFEAEEFGVEKAGELRKQIALGAFSCVECGRCQDQCPAYQTGKKLSPKQVALDVRRALLEGPDDEAVGKYVDKEMLWECTTCASCVEQCPVGVDQLAPILEFRRSQGSEGEFPETFGTLFKNLERAGNPWSYPRDKAEELLGELEIPLYEEQPVLWWMGCMARYDDNYRRTTESFSRILKAAGVAYGVLKDEKCTGDAARRAGNEMAFVELAMHNVELLNEIKATTIVTTCPHCAKSLEEYKELGEDQGLDAGLRKDLRIVHAVRYVKELYNEGRLSLVGKPEVERVIFHDPCYLSRHKSGGDGAEMRFLADMAGAAGVEPGRTGGRSFCCGAGGAQVFNEEGGDRYVYKERIDELLALGSEPVATACPFCRLMLIDGLKDNGIEEGERITDVLDLVAKRLNLGG